MRYLILAVLLLTGCATAAPVRTDTIVFDRGAFALVYADVSAFVRAACTAKKPTMDAAECARLDEVDKQVRKQIVTPPSPVAPSQGVDMEQVMKIIGALAKFAI